MIQKTLHKTAVSIVNVTDFKSSKKTIMFFPVEVGLAHIVRSLAIAEKLVDSGHRVLFALSKRKHKMIKGSSVRLLDISGYTDEDSIDFLPKLNQRFFVEPLVVEELKLLTKYKPDAVVIDFRVTAFASAFILDIPSFVITGSASLPYGCHLPNPGIPNIIYKMLIPFIQRAIWNYKSAFFKNLIQVIGSHGKKAFLNGIFYKHKYIVPEPSFYLPNFNKNFSVYHSGPIFWDGFDQYTPHWLKKIHPSGKTIYLTFGGTGFDKQKMADLSAILLRNGYTVIISTSSIADVHSIKPHPRLYLAKYLPGQEVSKRVDMVVCHGGFGTMTEAVSAGKPVVAVPYNPDQILNSLRFQELGLAKCATKVSAELLLNLIRLNWNNLEQIGQAVSADEVYRAIENVLQTKQKYLQSIKDFNTKVRGLNGAENAASYIINNI